MHLVFSRVVQSVFWIVFQLRHMCCLLTQHCSNSESIVFHLFFDNNKTYKIFFYMHATCSLLNNQVASFCDITIYKHVQDIWCNETINKRTAKIVHSYLTKKFKQISFMNYWAFRDAAKSVVSHIFSAENTIRFMTLTLVQKATKIFLTSSVICPDVGLPHYMPQFIHTFFFEFVIM